MSEAEEKFLLFDMTAGAYWRPNSAGYTYNRHEAGHFLNSEINDIMSHLKDRSFRAETIPPKDETETDYLQAQINTLRARLSRLSALLDEAEAALGPFANAADDCELSEPQDEMFSEGSGIKAGHLRLAASVAAKIAKEKSE